MNISIYFLINLLFLNILEKKNKSNVYKRNLTLEKLQYIKKYIIMIKKNILFNIIIKYYKKLQ